MISEEEFREDISKLREISRKLSDKRYELLQQLIRLKQKHSEPASPPSTQTDAENDLGPGPPGYHACCVPSVPHPPPWPPAVIPGFHKLRYGGAPPCQHRPAAPPAESTIGNMWERLLKDMGMEGQTFWPDHSDPIKKYKLSVDTIGEGFVFETLQDLPPVHEEDVLASHYGRDVSAPLYTVVGDRVQIAGQAEDSEIPDEASDMEDNIEKVESTAELFQRVPSTGLEGALDDLLEKLTISTESSVSRKPSKKSVQKAPSLEEPPRKPSRSSRRSRSANDAAEASTSRVSSRTRAYPQDMEDHSEEDQGEIEELIRNSQVHQAWVDSPTRTQSQREEDKIHSEEDGSQSDEND